MKPYHATLMAMAGMLFMMNRPLFAQESPSSTQPEASPRETPSSRRPNPPTPDLMRGQRQNDERPTAFMGVLTGGVPRELRAHFGLAEGFGLLVQEVMPGTPAQAAGIKVDDILVRFEDQKLVNMEQLQTLVRSKKKDDQVTLTIISGGKESQVTVKIGERMMPIRQDEPRRGEGYFQPFGGSSFFGGDRGGPDMMNEMRESLERYQKQMREYQERVKEWSRDGGKGSMPPAPSWNGPGRRDGDRGSSGSSRGGPRDGENRAERYQYRESANITRSDDSGIYSLRREGDKSIFTAKPKDGEEQSWPVTTDDERWAIPESMREKLRLLEEIRGSEKASDASRISPDSRKSDRRPGPDSPQRGGGI